MAPNRSGPFVALTIAGSDPSGGAGIQADLKTFSALGVYGTAVITALTAQNTMGVTGVHEVPAAFVTQQLETLVSDVRIDSIKIGMLANAEIIDAVADFLRKHTFEHVVVDPVMVATSGDPLLAEEAINALRDLVPLASVITPNLAEAAALLGRVPAKTVAEMTAHAHELKQRGARRVLLKGGHLENTAEARDVFSDPDGDHVFSGPRVATRNTHGTGCSLSSALAALRPQRENWSDTVRDSKTWLTGALSAADTLQIGHGSGPVHHFFELWKPR